MTTVFSQTFLMPRYAIFMTEKKERQTETERLKRMREIADSKEARERKSKIEGERVSKSESEQEQVKESV